MYENDSLTYFMSMGHFCKTWKYQKSKCRETDHSCGMR